MNIIHNDKIIIERIDFMAIGSDKTRIIVTLPVEIKDQLDKQAFKEKRTVANLVSALITDYLIRIENLERQQYYDFLANSYLNNSIIYDNMLEEMKKLNLIPPNMPPLQLANYVKTYVITNHRIDLDNFGRSNGLSFESYINRQITLNNPYQIQMFPNLYD